MYVVFLCKVLQNKLKPTNFVLVKFCMKKIVGLLSSLVDVSGLQHSLDLYTSGTVFMASVKLHQFILMSIQFSHWIPPLY